MVNELIRITQQFNSRGQIRITMYHLKYHFELAMPETFSLSNHIRNMKVFDNEAAVSEHDGREQYWTVYIVVGMEPSWVKKPSSAIYLY